jgi:histone deacetylase 1/2
MYHVPNPAYQHWTQHDQAILSGFVSSMTERVLGMIMFAGTSREAWETLSGAFASTSIARSSALRQEMAELKKGNKTVNVYFHQMKALSDSLTSIGEPLRDAEFVSYVLAGLDEEYDALYQVVTNRPTAIPIRDLFSQLQATEHRKLAQRHSSGASSHYPAAHVATPAPAAYAARGGPRPPTPSAKPSPPTTPKPTSGRSPVVCQLCGTPRHVASRCYKRFNRDFLGIGNDGSNTEKQLAMAMTASHGSLGSSSVDPAWYEDSGATHYITHELDKLTTHEPYHGTDQVHTANGTGMRIHNVGQAVLSTPSSRSLALHNVIHVPKATRNFLSMSKLSNDNNVCIELHPHDLFVKYLDTRAPILRGRCSGGLYEIKAPVIKQALSSVKVSRDMWYHRLGHPALQVVQHVLRSHEIPSTHESNKIECL